MTANQRVPRPKSSYDYGAYGWHQAWSVNVVNREASHRSGLVFQFSCGAGGDARPPIGGRCPCGAWYGELRGGTAPLPSQYKEHVSIRLCLEALQIFSDMAAFACQDCPKDTLGGDYYMINNELWSRVHPNQAGMLCLPCLEKRVGRRLQLSDFTDAPINSDPRIARFCSEGAKGASEALINNDPLHQGHYHAGRRDALLVLLRGTIGTWDKRLWLWTWRLKIRRKTQLEGRA